MNEIPEISICISVHNTASYLPRCLESIFNQSFDDYEVVLVNNGSTDDSLEVMEEFRTRLNKRVKVYSQEDLGLAQGRQTGINHAEGRYITFIDADDYYIGESLSVLSAVARTSGADIVEFQTLKDDNIISSPFEDVVASTEVLRYFFEFPIPTMLWLRMYKRELFDQDTMPKLYTNNEDSFVFPYILSKARNVCFIKKVLHNYFTGNENGVMKSYSSGNIDSEMMLKKKETILNIPEYLDKKIGEENLYKLYPEYKYFLKRIYTSFIFGRPFDMSCNKKIDHIVRACGLDSSKDAINIIKQNLQSNNLDKLIRMFGLNITYFIYKTLIWRIGS